MALYRNGAVRAVYSKGAVRTQYINGVTLMAGNIVRSARARAEITAGLPRISAVAEIVPVDTNDVAAQIMAGSPQVAVRAVVESLTVTNRNAAATITAGSPQAAVSAMAQTVAPAQNDYQRIVSEFPNAPAVRFTAFADTTSENIFEVAPSIGTLIENSPTGMYTDTSIIWIERFRLQHTGVPDADGVQLHFHRGGSAIQWSDYIPSLTDEHTFVFIDETNNGYVMWQVNDTHNMGGGFVNYRSANITVVAEDLNGEDRDVFLEGAHGSNCVLAIIPSNTWRPTQIT